MLENYMRFLHSAPHSNLFHISINSDIPLSTFASLIYKMPLCLYYVYFTVTLQLNSMRLETTTEELEAQVTS